MAVEGSGILRTCSAHRTIVNLFWVQDAMEYFQHLLELMARAERTAAARLGAAPSDSATSDAFRFGLENRIQVQLEGLCTQGIETQDDMAMQKDAP